MERVGTVILPQALFCEGSNTANYLFPLVFDHITSTKMVHRTHAVCALRRYSDNWVHQTIHIVVIFTFLIGGSFFATTDSALGQIKKPAKEGATFTNHCDTNKSLSEDEVQKLTEKVRDCWILPYGVVGSKKLRVLVEFELSIDGNLVGEPKLIATTGHQLTEKT
ncbi:MAG: hypothetical protein ACR2PH_07770, partial [Desulfobulbia bacterium]